MSQPTFLDWSRYQVPGTNIEYNGGGVVGTEFDSPQLDMSPYSAMTIQFINEEPTLVMEILITWAGFQGKPNGELTQNYIIGPSQAGKLYTTVKDRTCIVIIRPVSGSSTNNFFFSVTGLSHPTTRYDVYADTRLLVSDLSPYGVNATKLITAAPWFEGSILVTAQGSTSGGGFISCLYYDNQAAAFLEYATVGVLNVFSAVPVKIAAPPSQLQFKVVNGGTAQNIALRIVPCPD